jgi:hypothetical protein
MLVDFFNNPPDQINEQELQDYFFLLNFNRLPISDSSGTG